MTTSATVNVFFSLRVPSELVDALVGLQDGHKDRIDPQQPEHMHITLGFLHQADAGRLADASAGWREGRPGSSRTLLSAGSRAGRAAGGIDLAAASVRAAATRGLRRGPTGAGPERRHVSHSGLPHTRESSPLLGTGQLVRARSSIAILPRTEEDDAAPFEGR
ncbi:2'-5' RNA ligase family protein [Streptomyces sp. NPDC050636]|uniref:2'-5' RNA ligase family protein n=1 Tax=Streptomyces sp. NPDC050636 TaxID=3154510 RepID=UPI003440FEC6